MYDQRRAEVLEHVFERVLRVEDVEGRAVVGERCGAVEDVEVGVGAGAVLDGGATPRSSAERQGSRKAPQLDAVDARRVERPRSVLCNSVCSDK